MKNLPWEIEKIIYVANALRHTGQSGASTSERIAAAFDVNPRHGSQCSAIAF